jgi:predicted nucleotidyltransferase
LCVLCGRRHCILVNIHGLRPGRATRDIDFGIAIENWDRFTLLKKRLVAPGGFMSDRRALQRLTYSDQAAGFSIPVDLIPFRGVTTGDGTIEWPPSRDIVMNVAGFEDALASSIPIQIEENLIVRVASIPGLTLLKLVAWADRGRETAPAAMTLIRSVLQSEQPFERLVNHMVRTSTVSETAKFVKPLLISFRRGLLKNA